MTVCNDQGEIWEEEYTMGIVLHAKFGADQPRGRVGAGGPNFKFRKIAVSRRLFVP